MKTEKPERVAVRGTEAGRRAPVRRGREQVLRGIAVSPGVAIGPIFDTTEELPALPRRSIPISQVEAEKQRLAEAVAL